MCIEFSIYFSRGPFVSIIIMRDSINKYMYNYKGRNELRTKYTSCIVNGQQHHYFRQYQINIIYYFESIYEITLYTSELT